MKPRRTGLVVALTALRGAGSTRAPLTMAAGPAPDLRGTWTGMWGASPLTLLVLEQHEASPGDGVSLGSWHVLGRELPGVSGVLTFTVRGEAISVNVQGRLGDSNRRLTLVLEPVTVNGGQITLTRLGEHRLAGVGTSQMSSEPQGPAEPGRQAPQGPGAFRL